MQRRTYVAGLGGALAGVLAGCSALGSGGDGGDEGESDGDDGTGGGGGDGGLVNPSFEDDLTGWTVGKDLPVVPGEDEGLVDHGVQTVTRQASEGESAVEFYISGIADDGTIWVEQPVDFTDVATVELDAYSQQESFNEIAKVAFFAGERPADGLAEADFNTDEHVEDHEGWKTYSYDVAAVSGSATLAVGMTVIWETEVYRLFDNVVLTSE